MSIANTILEQLGGANRLNAMTGADSFLDIGNGLQFSIKSKLANKVLVTLCDGDVYSVEFWKVRGTEMKQTGKCEQVFAEQLTETIERGTGLALAL